MNEWRAQFIVLTLAIHILTTTLSEVNGDLATLNIAQKLMVT